MVLLVNNHLQTDGSRKFFRKTLCLTLGIFLDAAKIFFAQMAHGNFNVCHGFSPSLIGFCFSLHSKIATEIKLAGFLVVDQEITIPFAQYPSFINQIRPIHN